jgi:hypothetical protein
VRLFCFVVVVVVVVVLGGEGEGVCALVRKKRIVQDVPTLQSPLSSGMP